MRISGSTKAYLLHRRWSPRSIHQTTLANLNPSPLITRHPIEPSRSFYTTTMKTREWLCAYSVCTFLPAFYRSSSAFVLPPTARHSRSFSTSSDTASDSSQENAAIESPNEFATTYHAPVMWKECIDALMGCQRLQQRREGQYDGPVFLIDGTLGGAGHSSAILQQLSPGDVLFGCDVDPAALKTAQTRLEAYCGGARDDLPLFVPVQSNFCDLADVLPTITHSESDELILGEEGLVDGILLDLGVSSHQIDTADRGFAFMKDGPLDMRMSGTDTDKPSTAGSGFLTAAHICNEWDEHEIRRILRKYGDEARAKKISEAIVNHRPLYTTFDLMNAVASVTPQFVKKNKRLGLTSTLARVFQSLRIVVNQEDQVLEKALLDMCPAVLRPGGRLVVLSYHSMEDRATKRMMRDGTLERNVPDERDIYGNYIGKPKPFRKVGKMLKASEEEVEVNSRARSATLRIAERQ